ncbi:hypothetical protein [Amycolatopsis sp. lyj-112]|uniref:hypothetical protein n=1 Tax=Amycolatopsis sp. lyj-112 TaxID=2789288 RepID=UPI00397A9BCE
MKIAVVGAAGFAGVDAIVSATRPAPGAEDTVAAIVTTTTSILAAQHQPAGNTYTQSP